MAKLVFIICSLIITPVCEVLAVTINFSSVLINDTCTLDIDTPTVNLGNITYQEMVPNTLLAVQRFSVNIRNCSDMDAATTRYVQVTGNGFTQNGKWFFRDASSSATGSGIIVIKSDSTPVYNDVELKSGDTITAVNSEGNSTVQTISFYAGFACGNSANCSSATPGNITASLLFVLNYK